MNKEVLAELFDELAKAFTEKQGEALQQARDLGRGEGFLHGRSDAFWEAADYCRQQGRRIRGQNDRDEVEELVNSH